MIEAISYKRFSSPKQAKGDSERRQTELAEDYCALHPAPPSSVSPMPAVAADQNPPTLDCCAYRLTLTLIVPLRDEFPFADFRADRAGGSVHRLRLRKRTSPLPRLSGPHF